MLKTRSQNVTASQWSPNGGPWEQSISPSRAITRSEPTCSRWRSSASGFPRTCSRAPEHDQEGRGARPSLADAVAAAMKDWAIEQGATHYTHLFQPMTGLTAEKHDSFLAPTATAGDRRVQRQGADPGRARRLLLPLRRHPRHVRGPRLHRLGPDQPGVHPREPQRHDALHPDGVLLLDRRGARQEDPAAPLDGGALEAGVRGPQALRQRRRAARLHHRRPRAGILPDRQELLLRPARPVNAGRTLFGAKPPKGQELEDHYFGSIPERVLACMLGPRPSCTSSACRSRPGTTRSPRPSTRSRRSSRTPTSPPTTTADHGDDAAGRRNVRPRLPAAREAVRRHQRLGQAHQLVDGHRHGRQPAQPRRHAARQRPVPGLLRGRHPGGRQARRACSGRRSPAIGQRPPPGRQRGPAGDHLDLPRRQLQDIVDQIEKGGGEPQSRAAFLEIGVYGAAAAAEHAGDRNRTSPFAFTGNKFEFRAVGSSQSLAGPNTVLNTIVAEALDDIADKLEAKGRQGPATAETEVRPGGLRRQQGGHLQRRQLRRGLARGGREARPARTAGTPGRLPEVSPSRRRAVRQVRGPVTSASSTRGTRSCWSSTSSGRTSRPRPRTRSPGR